MPQIRSGLTTDSQFENLTSGQVKWPRLMNAPNRSCCISVDAPWRNKHNDFSPTALTLFCEESLTQTCSWPAMTSYMMASYELYGGRRLAARWVHPLPNSIGIVTAGKVYHGCWKIKWKESQQETFPLTGRWRDLENKVIAQQPKATETRYFQTICRKIERDLCKKERILIIKTVACS